MTNAVVSLRRYPVKSMGGEDLDAVTLDLRGLVGDRWYAVEDQDGFLASGKDSRRFRRRDPVFGYAARTAPDGGVVVAGAGGAWDVGDPALARRLSEGMGVPVRLAPEAGAPHQDAAAVSLIGTASLAWAAARWGGEADARRLRANIVIATEEPFVEETWVGASVDVGTATLGLTGRVPRCRMIDIDQDGAGAAAKWLKPLGTERDTCLAVYATVVRPGSVRVGDVLRLR